MKSIYFALLQEHNGERNFVMTKNSSLEALQQEFDNVRAVHRVEIEDNQRAMLETLLQIDSVTNTCFVEDLVAALFTAGYHFG